MRNTIKIKSCLSPFFPFSEEVDEKSELNYYDARKIDIIN